MQCAHNEEAWPNVIPYLTTIYIKHNVDSILRLMTNLSMSETPLLATLQQQHPIIDFQPYLPLLKEQTSIGWEHLKYG
eukprot:12141747-Ditylum_brightwellii.AAC.1